MNPILFFDYAGVAVFAATGALALPASAGLPFGQLIVFGASYEDVGQFPDYDVVAEALPGVVAPPGAGLDGSTGLRLSNLDPASGRRGSAWIEMFDGSWSRWQLTWASPHSTLYMFTHGSGKTQSMTRRLLHKMLAAGTVRTVAQQTVVDGALDAVAQAALRNSI